MTLEEIAETIENEEWAFLDENGLLDTEYIMERFNLTHKEIKTLYKLLGA